jgi:hypothetical protein
MILDQKFNGIIDQGTGSFIVYDDQVKDVDNGPRTMYSPSRTPTLQRWRRLM